MKGWIKATALFLLSVSHAILSAQNPFDGFYVGGNFGFATYRSERVDRDIYQTLPANLTDKKTNWAAGLQVGYDWSLCPWVVGLVGDWDWTNSRTQIDLNTNSPGVTKKIESDLRWISTLRARFGFASRCTLFFLTAGAAVADFKTHFTKIEPGFPAIPPFLPFPMPPLNEHSTSDKKRWGWTAGFGAEWAFGCHWSILAEILYANFGQYETSFLASINSQVTGPATTTYRFNMLEEVWLGRIGINYRFSLSNFGFGS